MPRLRKPKFSNLYISAFILMTAAVGNAQAGFAGVLEDPAISLPAPNLSQAEKVSIGSGNFWKISASSAKKTLKNFLLFQNSSKISPRSAPERDAKTPKRPLNPFQAARLIMTSA